MREICPLIRGLGILQTVHGLAFMIVAAAMGAASGMNRFLAVLLAIGSLFAITGLTAVCLIDRSVGRKSP